MEVSREESHTDLIDHPPVPTAIAAEEVGGVAQASLTRLEMHVVEQEQEFLALRSEWELLMEKSSASIYQTFDWQWFWWKYYGIGCTLHILAFRGDGRLVGLLPMFVETSSLAGKTLHRRLRLIGCGIASEENLGLPAEYGPSDYLDVIIMPDYESAVAEYVAAYMKRSSGVCDDLQFQNASHESFICTHLVPAFEKEGFTIRKSNREICPFLRVPPTMNEYFAQLQPNARHRLRQAKREFTDHPPFHIETVSSPATLHSAFLDLVHLHQARWNSLGYAGLFSDRRFKRFQNDVILAFQKRGWLWLKAVQMGGVRSAVRLGFVFKHKVYDYLSGFDGALPGANKRPSLALLLAMVEDAVASGAEVLDFLRGAEDYKFELATDMSHNIDVLLRVNPKKQFLRRFVYRLFVVYARLIRLLRGEIVLMKVHAAFHGRLLMPLRYASFVASRLKRKFRKKKH